MRIPMNALKLLVDIPAIVASTLIWIMLLALAPPALGLVGLLLGVVVLGLLATGAGEAATGRLLVGARPARAAERAVLADELTHPSLGRSDLGKRHVLVRQNVGSRTPPAQLLGRGHLVVTPWLIEAIYRGWLNQDEAAALLVHAEGRHRAEGRRCEVAMAVGTLPWRAGSGIARGIGRGAGWVPFIRFAWACRGVIGVIALVQQVDEGRPALGIFAGGLVAMTYLVPGAVKATARRVEGAGDDAVIGCGLGRPMAQMLRRYRLPVAMERLHRLDGAVRSVPAGKVEQREAVA